MHCLSSLHAALLLDLSDTATVILQEYIIVFKEDVIDERGEFTCVHIIYNVNWPAIRY